MGDENYLGGTSCKLLFKKSIAMTPSWSGMPHKLCWPLFCCLGGRKCPKAPLSIHLGGKLM